MNTKLKYLAIATTCFCNHIFSAQAHSAGAHDDIGAGEMLLSAAASVALNGMLIHHGVSTIQDPSSTDDDMKNAAAVLNAIVPGTGNITAQTIAETKATRVQLESVRPSLQRLADARSTTLSHVLEIYQGITYDPRSDSLSIKCKRPVFKIREDDQREIIQTAGFKNCQHDPAIEVSERYGNIVGIYAEENNIDLEHIHGLNIDFSDLWSNDNLPAHVQGILLLGGEEVVLTTNYMLLSNTHDILNYLLPSHKELTDISPDIEHITLKENGKTIFTYDYSCTRRAFAYLKQTNFVLWVRSFCGARPHQA